MAYVSLCKALYDYTATAEDELSFSEDALLYVVDADDEEWWKAKIKQGNEDEDDASPIGLIPSNYVEEAEPIRASRALYDYAKQNEDELDMQEDAMISIYDDSGDWLLVKIQIDGIPTGKLGFVPANYVDEVAAVDGVTSAPLGAVAEEEEYESMETAIPLAPSISNTVQKTAQNDDIKMWAVSELDGKKKKKKGTLGIGNSSLFFASESDKAPVQKISVLSIVNHTVEGKGKQLNLELDEKGAAKVKTDDKQQIRFITSNKGEVEEIWKKIEESQQKAREANDGTTAKAAATTTPAARLPPPPLAASQQRNLPPPSAKILPPPTRANDSPAPAPSKAASQKQSQGEACIALYDFEAQGDDELSVAENEKLILIEKENDDWWKVQNASGQEGVVPASYVEVGGEEEEQEEEETNYAAPIVASSRGKEKDKAEYAAAAAAASAAAEEEERQRQEEEEEAEERARLQAERRAKADAQRRAREAEERRREALKSQPAPAPPKSHPTTAGTSTSVMSRDIAIPSNRSAPARPKEASSKSKPSPARTRIWHDRTGQFRVEAEFLGFNQGKIRLHKLNGVVIEVAVEKMSNADIQYLEDVTGRRLSPQKSRGGNSVEDMRRAEREKEKKREQEREQKRRQEAARGPKRNVDWFEFFLAAQVDVDDCTRYAAAFERDKIDESVLSDMEPGILRSIGLREGDIIRVMKFINKKYKTNGTTSKAPNDQIKDDEALARKLQEQEQNARKNGVTPPPSLFSGPDGSLKNNTRRGRPTPSTARNTNDGVDAASLAAASETLAKSSNIDTKSPTISMTATSGETTSVNGFDDDAWTPRPASTKPPASPQPVAPPKAAASPAPAPAPSPSPTPVVAAAPTAAPSPKPSTPTPASVAEPTKPAADPNSALFDKLAAMRPPSGGQMQRPGASPSNSSSFLNGPRGPYAPVAQNSNMLQPLVSTQGTGQFLPTSMGHQQTGMMQPQQTGYMGMQPQPTGYMGPQQTGFGYGGGSPFGMQAAIQPTGYGTMQSPQFTGYPGGQQLQPQMTNVSGFAQPLQPQYTSSQYQEQQQVRANAEANSESNPERFSAANIFGQMKQGRMHQDQNKEAQSAQKYDALRPQPTGFQPGGYLNPQFTGYTYQQY